MITSKWCHNGLANNQFKLKIYCDGPVLQAVQDARLFPDSKYFVDMPLKIDPGKSYKSIKSHHFFDDKRKES